MAQHNFWVQLQKNEAWFSKETKIPELSDT